MARDFLLCVLLSLQFLQVLSQAIKDDPYTTEDPYDYGPAGPKDIFLTACRDRTDREEYNQRLCKCFAENNHIEVEDYDRDSARHLACSCDSSIFPHNYKQALAKGYDIEKIEILPPSESQIEPRTIDDGQPKPALQFVLPPNTQSITFEGCKDIKFKSTLKPESLQDITIVNARSFTLETPLSKDLKSLEIKGQNSQIFNERTDFIKAGMKGKPIIDGDSTGTAELIFENVNFPSSSSDFFKDVKAKSIEIKWGKFDTLLGSGTIFGDMDWNTIESLKISNTEIGSIFDLGLDKNHAVKDNTITFIDNEIKSTCDKRQNQLNKSQCFIPEKKILMDSYTGNKIICKCEENGKCPKHSTGIFKYLHACNDKTLEQTACSDSLGEDITLAMMKEPDSNCDKKCTSLEICLITIKPKHTSHKVHQTTSTPSTRPQTLPSPREIQKKEPSVGEYFLEAVDWMNRTQWRYFLPEGTDIDYDYVYDGDLSDLEVQRKFNTYMGEVFKLLDQDKDTSITEEELRYLKLDIPQFTNEVVDIALENFPLRSFFLAADANGDGVYDENDFYIQGVY